MAEYTQEMVAASVKLSRFARERESLEHAIWEAVEELREAGGSWVAVGSALGTSGQAAWERYSGNAIGTPSIIPQEPLTGWPSGPVSHV